MLEHASSLHERLRGSLWFVPAVCVAVVVGAAIVTIRLDESADGVGWIGFSGSPDAASTMLAAIAGAIVTLTALVFSVTIVALQLASSQYSPRVLRSFLRDRRSQLVLGVFLATFAYTMVVLRSVRGDDGDGFVFVPALSVHVAFGLTGLSLGFFVFYVHHIARSMQASVIVARVADEGTKALKRLYPEGGRGADEDADDGWRPHTPSHRVRWRGRSGYLQTVDVEQLLREASAQDGLLHVLVQPGDFVTEGMVVAEAWVEDADSAERCAARALTVGRERTLQQDAGFAFRQLVDVAERALSPGVNDPTTAVQALDRVIELTEVLLVRDLPDAVRRDGEGRVRLLVARAEWDDFVHLAFDEIRLCGEGSIQVAQRLHQGIDALIADAPPGRRPALDQQRRLLERGVDRSIRDSEDRQWVLGERAVPRASWPQG